MHSLLLFDIHDREIPLESLDRIFRSTAGFRAVKLDPSSDTPIQADYEDKDRLVTMELDEGRKTLSMRGTSDTGLQAAWLVQRRLDMPLRMVDTAYSFDALLSDFETLEELQAAIDRARTSESGLLI